MTRLLTTPVQPKLTVTAPIQNAVVGKQRFQVTGQVTDRGGAEPILIDAVTVQVDGGPLIHATLKIIPNKTLTQVSFHASMQISGGNDPHTVTVVATNDQGLRATSSIRVFAGTVFQVDAPAMLLDARTLIPITANDPQVLSFIGTVQKQLISLSTSLASAGKVLIGPNLLVQPISAAESLVRVGLWIEDPGFPVVPPSADFPLPRLSDAAASAAFAATPVLSVPNPGSFPSFALSVPVLTLQHLIDMEAPALKADASKQGLAIDTIRVETKSPARVDTNITGTILDGTVPASITISETVGLTAVRGGPSEQREPAVLSTDSSSSVGSILDWVVGNLVPLIGGLLAIAWDRVSTAASHRSGVAGSLLASIPARIPFGNKAITLPAGTPFQMPDFPSVNFFWNSFQASPAGLLGAGTTEIGPRTEADVNVTVDGPNFFTGFQDNILEFTDPTMGYVLENIAPDAGQFGWQISGERSNADALEPPNPAVEAGDFFPHVPLPLKVSVGDHHFNLAVHAIETCESDPAKTLTGAASKALLFRVKKRPIQ